MKILVAGANGYLGGRISNFLAEQGHSVTAIIRNKPKEAADWENRMDRIVQGDARDEKTIIDALEDNPECIIYTISLDHRKSGEDPYHTLSINVGIFWKLLEIYSAKQGGRIIYFSTQQVYGRRSAGDKTAENEPVRPVNAYGLTHKYCEDLNLLYSQRDNIEGINVRISNGYGAPQFPFCNCWWLVINDFCRSALENNKIQMLSDGTPQRDFVSIADLSKLIEKLATLDKNDLDYEVYNVGSGKAYTMLEVAHIVSDICKQKFGKDIQVVLPEDKISKDASEHKDLDRLQYDISRIKEIGFNPHTDLSDGISEVLDFVSTNKKHNSNL